jgi:hypothetical protein
MIEHLGEESSSTPSIILKGIFYLCCMTEYCAIPMMVAVLRPGEMNWAEEVWRRWKFIADCCRSAVVATVLGSTGVADSVDQ